MKVDEWEERIDFKAVESIRQEVLLGTDFCLAFGLEAGLYEDRWRTNKGTWYRFKNQKAKDPEKIIGGTIVTQRKGEKERLTTVEGVRDWVCRLEWLREETEGQG